MIVFSVVNSNGDIYTVYDIRSNDYGDVEFLVFCQEANDWCYVEAKGFRPIV